MNRIAAASLAVSLAFATLAPAALAGPGHSHDEMEKTLAAARQAPIQEFNVNQLAEMIEDGKVAVFDANGEETRRKYGVIPGATLLASSSAYDLAVLPADTTRLLVFYCANPRCTAAETAAARARKAGYTVGVLRAGIAGWHDAGKDTQDVASES